jgi:hypothetical protein
MKKVIIGVPFDSSTRRDLLYEILREVPISLVDLIEDYAITPCFLITCSADTRSGSASFVYDPENETCTRITIILSKDFKRSKNVKILKSDRIFVFQNRVCFDESKWIRKHHRLCYSLCSTSKCCYFLGGLTSSNEPEDKFSVSKYDEKTKWTKMSNMKYPRMSCGVVLSPDSRKLFLFGGRYPTETCEVYDLESGKSSLIPPLPWVGEYVSAVLWGTDDIFVFTCCPGSSNCFLNYKIKNEDWSVLETNAPVDRVQVLGRYHEWIYLWEETHIIRFKPPISETRTKISIEIEMLSKNPVTLWLDEFHVWNIQN